MKRILLSAFFSFLLGSFASAQMLTIPASSINLPDTVIIGSSHVINVDVINNDTNNYIGQFVVKIGILDTSNSTIDILDTQLVGNGSINAFDTLNVGLNPTFSSPPAIPGGNVVVVWPSTPTAPFDSTEINVWVLEDTTSGLRMDDNWPGYSSFKVFPNPAKDQLFFTLNNNLTNVELVRITDLSGKEVASYKNQSAINISALSRGVYMVMVTYEGDKNKFFRLVKD